MTDISSPQPAPDGGPAFPNDIAMKTEERGGMPLRDYFATHATEADLVCQREILREQMFRTVGIGILPDDWRATARYMHADTMLKARTA